MAMTVTQKILAAHAGREEVFTGELLRVPVDLALANDITAPLAISEFEKAGARQVFDREKIVLVPDLCVWLRAVEAIFPNPAAHEIVFPTG